MEGKKKELKLRSQSASLQRKARVMATASVALVGLLLTDGTEGKFQ
jgi:hypothetical protein